MIKKKNTSELMKIPVIVARVYFKKLLMVYIFG